VIQFVVIQRLSDGGSRLVSMLLMDFLRASRTQGMLQHGYPTERFEVAVATRTDREQIARLTSGKLTLPPATPAPGQSLLSKVLVKLFPQKGGQG